MSLTRKEHSVDAHTKGAASFFVACSGNPETTLEIPAAIRAKWYSDMVPRLSIEPYRCRCVGRLRN